MIIVDLYPVCLYERIDGIIRTDRKSIYNVIERLKSILGELTQNELNTNV